MDLLALRTARLFRPALGAFLALLPGTLSAQIISPGELASAHADLAGIKNCTQCHQLRQRGIVNDRCLSCHAPLRARIGLGRGLHATTADENCATCHKDHLGAQTNVVRFDTASFDHDEAGYALVDAHESAGCATCHNPTLIRDREVRRLKAMGGTLHRTFLGLGRTCGACHFREDPHAKQFGTDSCADCHGQSSWSAASAFDHANTQYPLTGLHQSTDCASCHQDEATVEGSSALYRGLDFQSCAGCHGDPHRGSLGVTCSDCHSTAGWSSVPRSKFVTSFDHRVTGYALAGAHGRAECASCHQPEPAGAGLRISVAASAATQDFPPPRVEQGCASCHLDYHRGELDGPGEGTDCGACHTEGEWLPSRFDVFAHAETDFSLTQAHRAVRCASCHVRAGDEDPGEYRGFAVRSESGPLGSRMLFALPQDGCESCHLADDPHGGQFGDRTCSACHTPTAGYAIENFDHGTARFALDGAHQAVTCAACHKSESRGEARVLYRPIPSRCQDCHVGGTEW